MQNIDNEWDHFMNTDTYQSLDNKIVNNNIVKPECSDLYISTKTKITYLNSMVDLQKVFWNIPILHYYDNQEGVIKKQLNAFFQKTIKMKKPKAEKQYFRSN